MGCDNDHLGAFDAGRGVVHPIVVNPARDRRALVQRLYSFDWEYSQVEAPPARIFNAGSQRRAITTCPFAAGINLIMPTLLGEAILPMARSAIRPPRWTLGLCAAGGAPVIAALSGPPTAEAQALNLRVAIGGVEVRAEQAQAAHEQRLAADLPAASSRFREIDTTIAIATEIRDALGHAAGVKKSVTNDRRGPTASDGAPQRRGRNRFARQRDDDRLFDTPTPE
jgi:hypothetical protein